MPGLSSDPTTRPTLVCEEPGILPVRGGVLTNQARALPISSAEPAPRPVSPACNHSGMPEFNQAQWSVAAVGHGSVEHRGGSG